MQPGMQNIDLEDGKPSSTPPTYVTGIPAPNQNPYQQQSNPWNNDPSSYSASQPFATSFETSAPVYQYDANGNIHTHEKLPCGCGVQWTIFAFGWIFWPLWYVGPIARCTKKPFDPRENPGFIANCIMSVLFTILWMALLGTASWNDYYGPPSCELDPHTGLCL